MGVFSDQTTNNDQCGIWVLRIKQASDDDIASTLVGDRIRSNREGKAVVGFGEAVGVAESVDDGGDVERVGGVAAEAEVVEEAEGFVDAAVHGAEFVNLLGPVGGVGYAHFWFLLFWFVGWLLWRLWKRGDSVGEEE